MHVLQVLQLPAQQDVLLAHIAVNQRHLRLVRGVAEDLADELVHGRDARAAGHHADVAVLVGLPLVLGDRPLERERLAHVQFVDVRRHRAPGVLLHQQVQVAGLVLVAHGRVRPDGRLSVSFALELGQQGRCSTISITIYIYISPGFVSPGLRTGNVKARDALAVRQLEPKLLNVMADLLNRRKLQVDPSLITTGKRWLAVLLNRRAGHLLHLPVVVSCTSSHRKTGKQRSLRRGLGRLCRVLPDTLLSSIDY